MQIQERILKIFPEINWTALNRTNYDRIRFYFDDIKRTQDEILNLSTNVLKHIFQSDNIYCCLIIYSNKASLSKSTLESVKQRWLGWILEVKDVDIIKCNNGYWIQFFSEIKLDTLLNINKAIIEEDYWIDPELSLKCFYFDFKKKLCINLYDDRWMDIIGDRSELNDISDKFKSLITIKFE